MVDVYLSGAKRRRNSYCIPHKLAAGIFEIEDMAKILSLIQVSSCANRLNAVQSDVDYE